MTRAGRPLSDSSHAGNYAPKLIMRSLRGKGFKRNELAGAMERLFADGKIESEKYGRASDERRHIVRAKPEGNE